MCYASDYQQSPVAHQLCNSGSQCGFYVRMDDLHLYVDKNFPSMKKLNYGLHNATMIDGIIPFENGIEIESCAPRIDNNHLNFTVLSASDACPLIVVSYLTTIHSLPIYIYILFSEKRSTQAS